MGLHDHSDINCKFEEYVNMGFSKQTKISLFLFFSFLKVSVDNQKDNMKK
jgi:hypothetical protein